MLKMRFVSMCALALLSHSIFAADSAPKEDVAKAAKALSEKGNYSWTTTVTVPPDARFRPGPTEGKTEKGGPVYLKMIFNDNTTEAVLKDKKLAVKADGNDWRSGSDLEGEEGRLRFMAARLREFTAPAEQAQELLQSVKELKKEGDAYTGQLTEEGAKKLMRFRRGGDGPEISGAKGSAKFWVKDGVLSKFEHKVSGSINFNGNDVDMDRTTTTEIKDVGTTKVMVPEAATKKLS